MVDGVLGIVSAELLLVEHAGRSIQLHLQLGGQSALEVDSPQRFGLADGNGFNLFVVVFFKLNENDCLYQN